MSNSLLAKRIRERGKGRRNYFSLLMERKKRAVWSRSAKERFFHDSACKGEGTRFNFRAYWTLGKGSDALQQAGGGKREGMISL